MTAFSKRKRESWLVRWDLMAYDFSSYFCNDKYQR